MAVTEPKEETKNQRIEKEYRRLKRVLKDLDERTKRGIDSLMQRAAFLKVTLEDMESDIAENGTVEDFQQSPDVPPYKRERPIARQYNTMTKNYQSAMKQLLDYIPKTDITNDQDEESFDSFVQSRD